MLKNRLGNWLLILAFSVPAVWADEGVPVEVVPVEAQVIRAMVYGQGTARATRREFLSFEAEGRITHVKPGPGGRDLAPGDRVQGPAEGELNGELLASVDSRDSLAQLDIAKATVEQARQQGRSAATELERARADAGVARADLRRMRDLVKKRAISRAEFEKSEASAKQAAAVVKAAQAGVETARSTMDAAQAQLLQAQLAVERTSIFAPMSGVISYLNIKQGQYFSKQRLNTSSEGNALETMPIVIIDPSEFEITLDLPTFQGRHVKAGQKVYVVTGDMLAAEQLADDLSQAIEGRVFSVSPSINPGGRSIRVTVRVEPQLGVLNDGMFVNCWLVVEEKSDALVVPYNTLLHEGGEAYVYVADPQNGTAQRRVVTRGIRGLHGVEISSGLKQGDQVVGRGRSRLTDGTPIKLVSVRGESRP